MALAEGLHKQRENGGALELEEGLGVVAHDVRDLDGQTLALTQASHRDSHRHQGSDDVQTWLMLSVLRGGRRW